MSSNSSVPMEPAPPSLVERLRAWEVWELDKGAPPPPTSFREAADRIEELERAIWTMHGEANEHIKRIQALEAALQEIEKFEVVGIKERARRALQAKP